MNQQLTLEQALKRADRMADDINYAEQAGLSKEYIQRLYDAYDRLVERAGFGPLI